MSDRFSKVYGVEMVESAIKDANLNVNRNNLGRKCAFICGRAEDKIAEICQTSAEVRLITVR